MYFERFQMHVDYFFVNLEAFGKVMYSGGCFNATKEECQHENMPLVYAKATVCVCKSDFCNSSDQLGSSHLLGCFVWLIFLFFEGNSILYTNSLDQLGVR